jgi:hypothetical protein
VTRQDQGIFSAGGRAPSIRENRLGTRLAFLQNANKARNSIIFINLKKDIRVMILGCDIIISIHEP